jgi:hypothetical protein
MGAVEVDLFDSRLGLLWKMLRNLPSIIGKKTKDPQAKKLSKLLLEKLNEYYEKNKQLLKDFPLDS